MRLGFVDDVTWAGQRDESVVWKVDGETTTYGRQRQLRRISQGAREAVRWAVQWAPSPVVEEYS